MGAVITPLAEEARSIFTDLGYTVSGSGREFSAERKWRVVASRPPTSRRSCPHRAISGVSSPGRTLHTTSASDCLLPNPTTTGQSSASTIPAITKYSTPPSAPHSSPDTVGRKYLPLNFVGLLRCLSVCRDHHVTSSNRQYEARRATVRAAPPRARRRDRCRRSGPRARRRAPTEG